MRLVLRTLRYYRASNVALALGVAVATAVLTGSLLVGESVPRSLVSAVERRLGHVDHVVTSPGFFPASLAVRLSANDLFRRDFARAAPVLLVPGSCAAPGSRREASRVAVYGAADIEQGTCVVSEALADSLQIAEGATVVLRTARTKGLPLDLPMAAEAGDMARLRVRIVRVAPPSGMEGAFSLYGNQRAAKNCWVSLEEFGRALDLPGRANLLFVEAKERARGREGAALLSRALGDSATLEDYGLELRAAPDGALVAESGQILMGPAIEAKLLRGPGRHRRVLPYLADTIRDERTGREVPYSMVAGVDSLPGGEISPGEIALNRWAAEDLGAKPGDTVTLEYSVREEGGVVSRTTRGFRLARVVETRGIGADATLVPRFEGITDAESLADWDPPQEFGFRAGRIRPKDEAYWKVHRTAPKALLNVDEARELWGSDLGALTSVRYYDVSREELEAGLVEAIAREDADAPPAWGARPIRAELLSSASGGTDFGQLFLGLSFFVVAAAALLVLLLMRLYVEGRASQIGTLFALGFTRAGVRGLLVAEGLASAFAGAVVGTAGGLGCAWLLLAGLRTLWVGAVGTSHIKLHVSGTALATGFLTGFVVSGIAIFQGVRRIEAVGPSLAMSGGRPGAGRVCVPVAASVALAMCAAGLVAASTAGRVLDSTAAFFGAGSCLLAALALASRAWFVHAGRRRGRRLSSLPVLSLRNASRNPARSTLTVVLLAAATFITVAVGAMRSGSDFDPSRRDGPSGGYGLIVEFDVPVPYDVSLPEGRKLLALEESGFWRRVEIASLRAGPGEDASCRNLYRPATPRVMSVPEAFIDDGAFPFASALDDRANKWELLRARDIEDDVKGEDPLPVIADYAAARWIMHKGVGDLVSVRDERGVERPARIVALVANTIFQSELLVSGDTFRRLYPGRPGYGRLLVRAGDEDAAALASELRRALSDFGVTVETTAERMASFAEVANSYISAFQALGALGLLLGSLGLVVVLARGVVERRAEIALMGSLGFGGGRIAALFAAENVFLLAAGVFAGAASAAVAVAPEFARSGTTSHAGLTLAAFCGIVVTVAALLSLASAWLVRDVTPAALRRE
jgi:hypothetical protein